MMQGKWVQLVSILNQTIYWNIVEPIWVKLQLELSSNSSSNGTLFKNNIANLSEISPTHKTRRHWSINYYDDSLNI